MLVEIDGHPAALGWLGSVRVSRIRKRSPPRVFSSSTPNSGMSHSLICASVPMSHSPALYLIGPEGEWLRQFTYGTPAAEILTDLKERL